MRMIFIFITILSLINPSFGSDSLKQKIIKMKLPHGRTIKVTAHPDYPPVVWFDTKSKTMKGVAVDLIQMILAEVDVKVEKVNVTSWGRAQEEVKVGRVDMLLPPYKTPDREKSYSFRGAPFLMDDTVIFVKKGQSFFYEKFDHLIGKKGVSIINDSFGHDFDSYAKEKLNMTRLTKTAQCFEFLLKDRADYFVAGYNAGLVVAKRMNINDEIDILPTRVVSTGMYFAISKQSQWNITDVENYISQRIIELHKDGTVERLQREYFDILGRL